MSSKNDSILIVGAGPVGLTAALELTRLGYKPDIIDQNEHRSEYSKAIGINPRTLELLKPSGVTDRLLSKGKKITNINFMKGKCILFRIDLSRINHHYNFMLALPQSETEQLIENRLNKMGAFVERGAKLTELRHQAQKVNIKILNNNTETNKSYDYVLGTDGAHSTVRRELNIKFPGTTIEGDWSLADVIMNNPFTNSANVILNESGFVFMLEFKKSIFRIVSNRPDVIYNLPGEPKIEKIIWKSDFTVSHRQASTYIRGQVYLAGDAAHIHSPLGGRGMNMGIEDVCTWVELYSNSGLDKYSDKRLKAGRKVISLVKVQTYLTTNANPIIRFIFTMTMKNLLKSDAIHRMIAKRIAGLN